MRVSFVIPAHNESAHIHACISAIRPHDNISHSEIVVITSRDTSDDTQDKAAVLGAKCQNSNQNSRAVQMNQGAKISTGDILCFVHADVQLPARADQLIVEQIKKEMTVAFSVISLISQLCY